VSGKSGDAGKGRFPLPKCLQVRGTGFSALQILLWISLQALLASYNNALAGGEGDLLVTFPFSTVPNANIIGSQVVMSTRLILTISSPAESKPQ